MRQFLLPVLLSAATLGMSAAEPAVDAQLVSAARDVKVNKFLSKTSTGGRRLAKGISISDNRVKRLDNRLGSNTLRPAQPRHKAAAKEASETAVLYESFEAWDGSDLTWVPDGWSRQTGCGVLSQTWTASDATSMAQLGIQPSEGNVAFGINYGYDQDEWLISPAVQVPEGMVFSFMAYIDPAFLFSLENVDWNLYEFTSEPEVAATVQVMAKAEGDADWTMLHDFVDDYRGLSLEELLNLSPSGLERKSVALGSFAGKKIQVALRYVGNDGNTVFVDELSIDYASLEGITFSEPLDIQYWGFERNTDLSCLNLAIAQIPVFSPMTWSNTTLIDGAEYSWMYCDPETAQMVKGGDEYELTVSYHPDYTSPSSKRNNFFYPPVLEASAPYSTPGTATSAYDFMQAGGKGEYLFRDGSELNCSLLPFLHNTKGLCTATMDYAKYGVADMPIFGHDAYTNKYWLEYTLNGEEPTEGDDVQLDGIMNFIYPSQAAMVVNAADVLAKGVMADDAELKLQIFALGADYVFDPDTQTPLATAICKGADILKDGDNYGHSTQLCVPFNFSTPVVLKASEDVPAYVVYLTGFNSDKVEYFAPMQSYYPDPEYIYHGWITKRMRINSDTYRFSATPLPFYQGEFGDYYNSFAIGLFAEHPWLTCEDQSVELPADGTPVEVALGSYYDGSKLNVEAPAGVVATVAGRYDECVLTLSHDDSSVVASGNVKVSGPGVEVVLPLSQSAGISDITADSDATVTGVYDLSGRRINAADATNGMFVVRYSDGTARKVAIK